jgi:CheY-like chemotaxis protein
VAPPEPEFESPQDRPLRRILVVDDNRDSADSLSDLLRVKGHVVCTAYDGWAALQEAKSFCPDVALLDLGMPGMDGCELARLIRQQPGLEQVVLAALTGWGQPEDRRRTAEAGFNHHLVKPPEISVLDALLSDPNRSQPASLRA